MNNALQCCFKRVEKKYLLTKEQYLAMRWGMSPYVTADRYANYTISNLYYDTDDYQLIRTSLDKPVYKEKLRMRAYGVPGDHDKVFIELKKKFEGVVYKRRIVLDADAAARYIHQGQNPEAENQISREIDYFMSSYQPVPKVFIGYDREAWAGVENPDLRITFDTNLRWRTTDLDLRRGDSGAPILPPDQILMELKIPGAAPLWLARLLSENHIFSTSFSKYGTWYKQVILGQGTPVLPDTPKAVAAIPMESTAPALPKTPKTARKAAA